MSTLKVSQIKTKLRAMFEAHLDLSDIPAHDKEREPKILSRCLAALAVYLHAACSEKEAASSVWDGPDDDGIDAAYFDAGDSRVLFVQSKWISKGSGEPEAKEIGAFTKGVRDAIEKEPSEFHGRLHGRLNDIILRLEKPGTSVRLVVVSTGASALARHGQSVVNRLLQDLNGDDPDPIASAEIMGLSEVYSGLANDPLQGSLTLEANILEWSYISAPYPAYFGLIDGLQLKQWWKQHGKRIVAANIRHSLGATEVNNQIKQTASSAPQDFWYFNNGITLVAEEAVKAPAGAASRSAGVFSFKGASVVNGAQTVSSLAKADSDASLGIVRVPIRVILLKTAPVGFGGDVTRTNNHQNRIEPRDFVAHDVEQKRIREEMAIEGIDYQFVRSEDGSPAATSCELIEVTTALACASGDPNLAVQIKTGVGRFFSDLGKPPYKALFNPSTSGARAFNATLVQRAIDDWIERKKRKLPKKSGPGWGVLVHGNRVLASAAFRRFGAPKLSQSITEFSALFQASDVDIPCEDAYRIAVDAIQTHYAKNFLAVLFKNPRMSKHIFELASA